MGESQVKKHKLTNNNNTNTRGEGQFNNNKNNKIKHLEQGGKTTEEQKQTRPSSITYGRGGNHRKHTQTTNIKTPKKGATTCLATKTNNITKKTTNINTRKARGNNNKKTISNM